VIRHQPVRWSVSALAAAAAISGCSWFHHKETYYASATESRPLEVPPDLDAPSMSNELVVPATSGTPGAAPASAATAAPAATVPPAVVLTSNNGLHVADSVDHAWQRVGLALERAQVGTISARDAAGHSYTVDVSGLTATAAAPAPGAPAAEHHWYSRILHPFGDDSDKSAHATSADAHPVSGRLVVKVSADGDGARVDVEGAAGDSFANDAAQRVLEVLRERLS
jgi:uncharacterized lipoprotein